MVHLSTALSFVAGLSTICGVFSAPVANSNTTADLVTPGTGAGPQFVVYTNSINNFTGPPPVAQVKGFNVVALSFLLIKGDYDKATEWTQLSAEQRSSIKSQYAAAGIKLIVSAFGSTDKPTTNGADPVGTANTMAAWVKQYDLDGIDVDYEDFGAVSAGDGKAEIWLASFTRQLPVAPWFSPGKFGGGAYLKVHETVGHLIDWYNVQFYNQGEGEYTTCAGLLTASSTKWPQASLFQIADSGIPLSKLVIGKPANINGANNGYMSASELAQCVQQAKNKGWSEYILSDVFDRG
ncbi:hypothetical protein D9615_009116 [Tricholomella constricta]|uniref:GH18 domain-containing protein n=1 Tax=Tricholomella constricta TaxID=117010 RepID=A0A8H5H0B0_9AGAR|nr:hypothetical protein D9615_009116 [Tricholomella constricta]